MKQRRVLDAKHLRDIFLRVISTKGTVREYRVNAVETVIVLRAADFPSVEVLISSLAINTLAEQLRDLTATGASASAEYIARMLAKISIIANHAGPRVHGSEVNPDTFGPLVERICIEFAVACAAEFASSFNYQFDLTKIDRREISIALMMRDEDAVAFIFGECLNIITDSAVPGRHARPEPRNSTERDANAYIQYLENQLSGVRQISNLIPKGIDRQLSASRYTQIRFIAAIEGWGAGQVLTLIDGYLSPYAAQRYTGDLIRYLEDRHRDAKPASNQITKDAERQLSAPSHWNLRSTATVEGWDDHQVLALIDEHLYPTLDPELVHHSNTVSGTDWRRMHHSIRWRGGGALWKLRAGSNRA